MKNLMFYFSLLLIVGCSDNQQQAFTTDDVSNLSSVIENLEITLSAQEDKSIVYENSKVIIIDGNYYLRSRSKDFVTTTLLIKNKEGGLTARGVSCSSSDCAASETGCIPKNDTSCTRCLGGNGDCKKTVTGGGCSDPIED